ncbi:hypothetical protein FSB65_40870 [Paraburkholderia sp. JPY418]|nr:hypothetical protein [Paraburkholderia youngii]
MQETTHNLPGSCKCTTTFSFKPSLHKALRVFQARLASGAKLTSVRDNLRHASIATTSMYLHGDEIQRARDMVRPLPPENSR